MDRPARQIVFLLSPSCWSWSLATFARHTSQAGGEGRSVCPVLQMSLRCLLSLVGMAGMTQVPPDRRECVFRLGEWEPVYSIKDNMPGVVLPFDFT